MAVIKYFNDFLVSCLRWNDAIFDFLRFRQ
jgi:hypothetical protein